MYVGRTVQFWELYAPFASKSDIFLEKKGVSRRF